MSIISQEFESKELVTAQDLYGFLNRIPAELRKEVKLYHSNDTDRPTCVKVYKIKEINGYSKGCEINI